MAGAEANGKQFMLSLFLTFSLYSHLDFLQLKVRDERLGEASELQKFLQDLDHFQQWLTRTQTSIASEDIPSSLSEAESLLNQHQQIKEEIDGYAPDYSQMKEYGEKVVEGQEDVQYMFLREVKLEQIYHIDNNNTLI